MISKSLLVLVVNLDVEKNDYPSKSLLDSFMPYTPNLIAELYID